MGKDWTPKYRVEANGLTPMMWLVRERYGRKGDGQPNLKNLKKWVEKYNESFRPGGVNHHVWGGCDITHARIIDQTTGDVVAEYST